VTAKLCVLAIWWICHLAPEIAANKTTSDMVFEDPLQFWEILSAAINENPPSEDQIKGLLPMFAPLGLELGSCVMPLIRCARGGDQCGAAERQSRALAGLPSA